MPNIDNEQLLKILQYEGKDRNAKEILKQAEFGRELIRFLLPCLAEDPVRVIETLTSTLGYIVMRHSISKEDRVGTLLAISETLLSDLNITQETINAKYTELKEKGILK